jgi:hypothetical protein
VSLAPRRRCSAHRIALFALLAMVAGCGPRLHTLPPGTKIPDLRGVWRGVWGNSQVLITLTGNDMEYGPSVLNIGPIPIDSVIAGDKEPTLSGIITYEVRGDSVSTAVRGRIASYTGRTTLVLYASPPDGDQELVLYTAAAQPNRLAGNGSSTFSWGPQGKIDLLRETTPIPQPPVQRAPASPAPTPQAPPHQAPAPTPR